MFSRNFNTSILLVLVHVLSAISVEAWPVSRYEDGYRKEYDHRQTWSPRTSFSRNDRRPLIASDSSDTFKNGNLQPRIDITFVGKIRGVPDEKSFQIHRHRPTTIQEQNSENKKSLRNGFNERTQDGKKTQRDNKGESGSMELESESSSYSMPRPEELIRNQGGNKDDDTLINEFFSGMLTVPKSPSSEVDESSSGGVSDIATNAVPDEDYGIEISHQSALAGIQNAKCPGGQVMKDGKCRNKARID